MDILRRHSIPAIYLSIPWIRRPFGTSCFVDSQEDLETLTEIKSVCSGNNCLSLLDSLSNFIIKGIFPDNILSMNGSSEELVEWQFFQWKVWDVLRFVEGNNPSDAISLADAGLPSQYLNSISNQNSCVPLLKELKKTLDYGQLTDENIEKIQKIEKPLLSQLRLRNRKGSDSSYPYPITVQKQNRLKTSISEKTRKTILRRDGFSCIFCGSNSSESKLEVDHIIPKALIKKLLLNESLYSSEENLCTTCIGCNREKRDYLQPEDVEHYLKMFASSNHPNHPIVTYLINIQALQKMG